MKPIKKFSMMAKAGNSINESAEPNLDAVMDLVKKMGYDSVEELKKEKNLLNKLEGLLKDFMASIANLNSRTLLNTSK